MHWQHRHGEFRKRHNTLLKHYLGLHCVSCVESVRRSASWGMVTRHRSLVKYKNGPSAFRHWLCFKNIPNYIARCTSTTKRFINWSYNREIQVAGHPCFLLAPTENKFTFLTAQRMFASKKLKIPELRHFRNSLPVMFKLTDALKLTVSLVFSVFLLEQLREERASPLLRELCLLLFSTVKNKQTLHSWRNRMASETRCFQKVLFRIQ